MKKNFIFIAILLWILSACGTAQKSFDTPVVNTKVKDASGSEMLLGHCSRSCLRESPFKEWFDKNYADYTVDAATADQLKPLLKDKTIVAFMGTWCGDSKREVPRLIKVLDYCGVPDDQLKLIMVDYQAGAYKQSPQHEEKGEHIFRVPTIIVMSGNKEIGRIIESPNKSIEKDLTDMLNGTAYLPNYEAANWVFAYTEKTAVKDLYKDTASIIQSIKPRLGFAGQLNSIGRVLIDQKENEKALFIFRLNLSVYPNNEDIKKYIKDLEGNRL